MSTSYFFLQAEKTECNSQFLDALEDHSACHKQQVYVLDRPLGDNKYTYNCPDRLIVLSPGYKLVLLSFGDQQDEFNEFAQDFAEDIASISDKYRYKDVIGRSRYWKESLIAKVGTPSTSQSIESFFSAFRLLDPREKRIGELLVSLLTGSINNLEQISMDVPSNVLDRVKNKIILFDGDQTRFIYQKPSGKRITIQGLSGTGKTELLMHKLKEIYTTDKNSRIMFTCHNKILADSLRGRIPDFFNFMKVEEQIRWNQRLWCVNAWGSQGDKNSGAYSYICSFYGIPFLPYSQGRSFDDVCRHALSCLANVDMDEIGHAFDFMLIDESQDFPESFFSLCDRVTKSNIYVAGDIFQSIFDSNIISEIAPDYLLSKCYRTDPRTLMFAHAIGMGLFETPKLRWLDEREWKACGYNVEKFDDGKVFQLTREPLRRFEDLLEEGINSIEIVMTQRDRQEDSETKIIDIIRNIADRYPTVTPDDIGVIFIDNVSYAYSAADRLEQSIPREFGWRVNKAYETKEARHGELLISNRNNVKGLEFPFVICVTKKIYSSRSYRNALYMMLTRSFIRSYLLTSLDLNGGLLQKLRDGLESINSDGSLRVTVPSDWERQQIQTTITFNAGSTSYYDFVHSIFDELCIPVDVRSRLYESVNTILPDTFEYDSVKETIEFVYSKLVRP
jgi:superfamily I DNA and RNA helicase